MTARDERWYQVLVKRPVPIRLIKKLREAPLVDEETLTPKANTFKPVPRDLTYNEKLVVFCLAEGMSIRQIAETLYKSEHTIKSQIATARYKLQARSVGQLIARALRWGQII